MEKKKKNLTLFFGEKDWPPPFEDSVIAMRSSLVQFTQKTQDWDRDDLAELRIYHKHKWKVPSVLSAALQSAQVKDKQAKQAYVDKRNRARPSDIKSGDKVLLYNRRGRTSYRRGMTLNLTQC